MRKALLLLAVLVCAAPSLFAQSITQGSLFASDKKGGQLGACPLKNTAVTVDISGFVARVRVVQDFENTFTEPIEAVYTFPLSQNGAVDRMTMLIGTRTIRGKILKREEARKVYETAKTEGKTAALLDQERPNIFTQSVANVMPGESVRVEISYVDTLKYEDGAYELAFPMTVGPRYIPGGVADAAKISPPIARERAGHDVSITVNLNAGVPVESIRSPSHEIEQINHSPNAAKVTLKKEKVIPNRDFILRYDVTGKRIEDAVIAHRSERGGFFTLILQPPDFPAPEDRTPKEIVFVLDTSGSMHGFPIEKAKEAMKLSLEGLYPDDTFNLITFAGDTRVLFDGPVPATQANIEMAQAFLDEHRGGGGTEMMKAIKAALDPSDSKEHLRIVCFMTDGYVGNENEIIAEVQRYPKARVFSFGIGNSVNRFLLDKMAEAGRGEVEYVSLEDDGSKAAKRFYERVRSPMLTDISIDWNGLGVTDAYPNKPGDLFSAKPVIVTGRFARGAKGTIKLKGNVAGQPYEREIAVTLPDSEPANDSLASLWARKRIDQLSNEALNSRRAAALNRQITALGLEFGVMTQFTSFIAVEEKVVNPAGRPTRVEVPTEAPDGVEIQTEDEDAASQGDLANQTKKAIRPPDAKVSQLDSPALVLPPPSTDGNKKFEQKYDNYGDPSAKFRNLSTGSGRGGGVGVGYGTGSGYGSGSGNGTATSAPPPAAASVSQPLKILHKQKAQYTDAARQSNIQGTVTLRVTFLASGSIGAITTIKGLPYGLTEQAIAAARAMTFEPEKINGVPRTTAKPVSFVFSPTAPSSLPTVGNTPDEASAPVEANPAPPEPSPAELREKRLKEKLHAWVFALAKRVESNSPAATNESHFVRDGRANLRVEFAKLTPELRERLKTVGFTIDSEKGDTAIGSISLEKIAELITIDEVKLVLPYMNQVRN